MKNNQSSNLFKAQNNLLACTPINLDELKKKVTGALDTINKTSALIKLEVLFPSVALKDSQCVNYSANVYIKPDRVSYPWAKERFSIVVDGASVQCIFVPLTEVVFIEEKYE